MYFNNEIVYNTIKRAGWNQDNLNYNLNRETELPEETLEYYEELFRMSASLFSLSSFMLHTLIFMLHFLRVALSSSTVTQHIFREVQSAISFTSKNPVGILA